MGVPDHRIDLLLVPPRVEGAAAGLPDVFQAWKRAGVVQPDGSAPEARRWVEGGFVRLRTEGPGPVHFYGHTGGFGVACPETGGSVVRPFNAAMAGWRAGGPRALQCTCGRTHALEDLVARPSVVFADAVVVLADAGRAWLTEEGERFFGHWLPGWRVVPRRC